jgi:putative transposase
VKYLPYQIYHIYNQGNNRQKIFFKHDNYLFFQQKMIHYLLPLVDVLAYCLMPNHFHWLVFTRPEACEKSNFPKPRKKYTESGYDDPHPDCQQNLSKAIAVMLRSYTRAVNLQEDRSGSLFRHKTKAKDARLEGLVCLEGPNRRQFFNYGNEYALQCFEYIHENPVEAGLVNSPLLWQYSSAKVYHGNQTALICNQLLTRQLLFS